MTMAKKRRRINLHIIGGREAAVLVRAASSKHVIGMWLTAGLVTRSVRFWDLQLLVLEYACYQGLA